jgi:hypothetical protein
MTTMKDPEYMLIPYTMFPPDIAKEYNIRAKVNHKGMILAKIIKDMYGLPQAGRLDYNQLTKHLQLVGFSPPAKRQVCSNISQDPSVSS